VSDLPPEREPEPDAEVVAEPAPVPSPDEIAEELAEVSPLEEERRYPSTIGGAFYLAILALAAVGMGFVWNGDWRLGVRLLASGLCAASALRLVLPSRDAGMLAVRHRLTDCGILLGVGLALFFLVQTIPDQAP
jgi:hypothetical protein